MTNPLDFLLTGSRYTTSRPAAYSDQEGLLHLLRDAQSIHRHLDWHQPLEWLGEEPFWLMENSLRLQAALAMPSDPPGVAWIRIFACLQSSRMLEAWQSLLEQCLSFYRNKPAYIAAIGLTSWFSNLLLGSGFHEYQDIVILQQSLTDACLGKPKHPGLVIRPIRSTDMESVLQTDQTAFETIWQVSAQGLAHACQIATYTSVAEMEGKIIGYQLSTSNPFSGHLARLAVLPEYQGKGIGTALVHDLQEFFLNMGIGELTVNTQNTNTTSLHLYQKLGFAMTGERFPVYLLEQ